MPCICHIYIFIPYVWVITLSQQTAINDICLFQHVQHSSKKQERTITLSWKRAPKLFSLAANTHLSNEMHGWYHLCPKCGDFIADSSSCTSLRRKLSRTWWGWDGDTIPKITCGFSNEVISLCYQYCRIHSPVTRLNRLKMPKPFTCTHERYSIFGLV